MEEIVIYELPDSQFELQVTFQGDTVWLALGQIALLFDRDKSVISKHLTSIFRSGELVRDAVVAKNATTAADGKTYEVRYYNLDAIIAVGYRVNSKRGTQFRQWATQRLKDYLVKGYAINVERLEQLNKVVNVIQNAGASDALNTSELHGLVDVIASYARSFVLLSRFDNNSLEREDNSTNITYEIHYLEAKNAIAHLKYQIGLDGMTSDLFGKEKDQSFEGALRSIIQTFDGMYLYPTIEEQAAHLLYFVIKDHPFSDGNKRIGAFLFVWFLEKNRHQFKRRGDVKINDNALVALTLLVAQSDPNDKELMISLICNLVSRH